MLFGERKDFVVGQIEHDVPQVNKYTGIQVDKYTSEHVFTCVPVYVFTFIIPSAF
jgi:hypothetical protein